MCILQICYGQVFKDYIPWHDTTNNNNNNNNNVT